MKFQGITGNFAEANVEALAVAVFKGEKAASGVLKDLDKLTGGLIAAVMKAEEFKGDAGEVALLRFAASGKVKASRLLLVGVGDKADYKTHSVAAVAGTATRFLRKRNVKSFALLPALRGRCGRRSLKMRCRDLSPANLSSINTRPKTKTTRL